MDMETIAAAEKMARAEDRSRSQILLRWLTAGAKLEGVDLDATKGDAEDENGSSGGHQREPVFGDQDNSRERERGADAGGVAWGGGLGGDVQPEFGGDPDNSAGSHDPEICQEINCAKCREFYVGQRRR